MVRFNTLSAVNAMLSAATTMGSFSGKLGSKTNSTAASSNVLTILHMQSVVKLFILVMTKYQDTPTLTYTYTHIHYICSLITQSTAYSAD